MMNQLRVALSNIHSLLIMERPKSVIFALLTIILILLDGLGWSHGCMDQEREALLLLKPFFEYLQWPVKAKEANSDCCEWKMVKCNVSTGRITKLSLSDGAGYDDQLWYLNTSYFLPFEQLTSLDLRWNRLAGFVENQGFETLSLRLTKLEELYLGSNHFNGSIISSLCGFSSLRSLDLSYNEMGTTLNINGFESLWRLSNLELLDVSWNKFNSTFLSSLRGLSSLKDLNLAYNQLEGTIDMEDLNNLVNLKRLDMYENHITGFGGSIKGDLEFLDLGWNGFNNSVFGSLNGLPHLKCLNLSGNQLTGSVHLKELASLRNLEELQLNYNNIEDIVGPKDKTILNKLKVLGLAGLQTNGKGLVLKSLGALSTLKTIDLHGNILNETNPFQDLFNLSTLEELFLGRSILHKDFLQNHVEFLTSLKVLHLSSCGLKGTLPDRGWCDLKNLEELDLGYNELEGELPPCMTNLSSLHTLRLGYNQFTGNIATTPIPNLQSIEFLSLENNHFELSVKSFANHSSLKFFVANDGNQLIEEATSQPWTPKFQLEVLSLSNASSLNFLYHQFNLRYLDISGSKFGGTFPNWLFENNTRLASIHLVDNSFMGPFQLPSHPNLNLSVMDISHNKLGGHIPSNISSIFQNLAFLNISHNSFLGTIPPSLGELKSFRLLDFSNNQLTGEIKDQFANTPLRYIKLSNNNLSFFIPNVSDPTSLENLLLDGNKFVGEIPDLSSLKNLGTLDISRNSLSGKLPSWIANMSKLREIVMFDNQFEGYIPLELCKLHRLAFLDLAGNDLSGSIPPCFSELTFLEHLHLRGNKLGGPISNAFRNCTGLHILDLSDNNFSGTIPKWIGNFSFLAVLLLEENNFLGNVPIELCQLRGLNILSISSNNLSGSLPACLSNLSSIAPSRVSYPYNYGNALTLSIQDLKDFVLSYLDISGDAYGLSIQGLQDIVSGLVRLDFSIQEVIELTTKSISLNYKGYILDHMYEIDLSHNRFSGEIPIEFGNLSNIRSLNLSHNNMTGLIPETFSNLKQLESLDLSYNELNGRIPLQLIEVTSLAVFIVAHNNLLGPVPTENQFETFNESSYEGNPLLCGPLLKKKCDETTVAPPATYPFTEQSEDDSFMEMTDFWVSFVAAYIVILLAMATVLYINTYWRQVWFYHIGVCINSCYYFVVDKF